MTGKFDGKKVILDEVPKNLPVGTKVMVIFEPVAKPSGLDAVIGIAGDADLPPNFSTRHEYDPRGTPDEGVSDV